MVFFIHCIFWLTTSLMGPAVSAAPAKLEAPVLFVQIPANRGLERHPPKAEGMLRQDYGEGGRLMLLNSDGSTEELSAGFASAADPEVSFDGKKILFSGKRRPTDDWNVFEMDRNGSHIRQITRDLGDCRNPIYQSTLYTIVSSEPWYQIAFTCNVDQEVNEYGSSKSTSLYSCRLDGSQARRLTYNISSDMDPVLLPDGRILFAGWQRASLNHGTRGFIPLFAINIDGTDFSLFSSEGGPIKQMPCTTTDGKVVFVESGRLPWDGAGQLASVTLRRNLSSYKSLTDPDDGLFHSPSPLPGGGLLVSRRPSDNSGTHGIYRLDVGTTEPELVFDDAAFHEIDAIALLPREEPDGRSSVVNEEDPYGQLYCLNSELTDLEPSKRAASGTVKRIRVLEGLPRKVGDPPSNSPVVARRLLGEVPIESDGSFFLEVPANIPIQLQTLDENGLALRSCGWIWVKNREARGCIGCHEDPELTPENRLVDAVQKAPYSLTLPAHRRRGVDFKHDVAPIVTAKCTSSACHAQTEAFLQHSGGDFPASLYSYLLQAGNYVHPGRARTSPMIWHILGQDTSRAWDPPNLTMPPDVSSALSSEEKRVLVEWIDMGASWKLSEEVVTEADGSGSSGARK